MSSVVIIAPSGADCINLISTVFRRQFSWINSTGSSCAFPGLSSDKPKTHTYNSTDTKIAYSFHRYPLNFFIFLIFTPVCKSLKNYWISTKTGWRPPTGGGQGSTILYRRHSLYIFYGPISFRLDFRFPNVFIDFYGKIHSGGGGKQKKNTVYRLGVSF